MNGIRYDRQFARTFFTQPEKLHTPGTPCIRLLLRRGGASGIEAKEFTGVQIEKMSRAFRIGALGQHAKPSLQLDLTPDGRRFAVCETARRGMVRKMAATSRATTCCKSPLRSGRQYVGKHILPQARTTLRLHCAGVDAAARRTKSAICVPISWVWTVRSPSRAKSAVRKPPFRTDITPASTHSASCRNLNV